MLLVLLVLLFSGLLLGMLTSLATEMAIPIGIALIILAIILLVKAFDKTLWLREKGKQNPIIGFYLNIHNLYFSKFGLLSFGGSPETEDNIKKKYNSNKSSWKKIALKYDISDDDESILSKYWEGKVLAEAMLKEREKVIKKNN